MESIDLQVMEIVSPFRQEIDFAEATAIVSIDSIGRKSWVIELTGPTTLLEYLNFSQDTMQLKVKAVDGRTLYGEAFVRRFNIASPYINMTLMGTGPLSPGAL